MPPPVLSVGALGWLRANLFPNWFNSLLTLFAVYLIWITVPPIIEWALIRPTGVAPPATRAPAAAPAGCSSGATVAIPLRLLSGGLALAG